MNNRPFDYDEDFKQDEGVGNKKSPVIVMCLLIVNLALTLLMMVMLNNSNKMVSTNSATTTGEGVEETVPNLHRISVDLVDEDGTPMPTDLWSYFFSIEGTSSSIYHNEAEALVVISQQATLKLFVSNRNLYSDDPTAGPHYDGKTEITIPAATSYGTKTDDSNTVYIYEYEEFADYIVDNPPISYNTIKRWTAVVTIERIS
jgi:hypothetical protein